MFLSCSHNNQPYLLLSSVDLGVYFFIHGLTEVLRLKNVSKCNVRNDGMTLKQILKSNKAATKSYYNIGKSKLNIILARIRMECIELNHHLFTMNIIDNPLCTYGRNETTNHFFIECPQYHLHRVVLVENLTQININYNLDTLLHGTRDSLLDLQLISLLDTFITAT